MTRRDFIDGLEGTPPRQTPYELAFSLPHFEADVFPGIREEAEVRGVRTTAPLQFLMLGTVGKALREYMPEAEAAGTDATGSPTAGASPGEVLDEFGRLFFQAYHFWRFGKRLLVAEPSVVRALVDGVPRVGDWSFTPPHPAGYLQLPRHLFWVETSLGAPPEPVDGFFWTAAGDDDPEEPPFRRLDLVLVAGMRPGRPGFSTLSAATELVGSRPGHWGDADARPGGRDFESVLPGGELDRLYSITNVLEVLKLVSIVFWYVATHAGAVVPGDASEPAEPPAAGQPALPPSGLAYERIVRVEG